MTDDLLPMGDAAPAAPRRAAERPRKNRTLRWTLAILLSLLLVLGGAGAGLLWLASSTLSKATSGRGGSPVGVFVPAPLSNEETGITNVLIAGSSFDDPGHGGALLTDSLMVASVNIKTKKTALISIPRDLWVDVNGRQSKINAVYVYNGGGDSGMAALKGAVEKVTGLHIDQYVIVGYTAVRDVVNAVGGVDVVIDSPDPRGIGDPMIGLYLPNGPQTLDGDTALLLARSRNDPTGYKPSYGLPGGDFDRQANQRMLIAAVARKAKTSPALANPAAILAIFDTIGKNVHTDLNAGQLRRFYDLFKDGPAQSVSIRGEGQNLLRNYSAPDGGAALAPAAGMFEYGPIQAFVKGVMGA